MDFIKRLRPGVRRGEITCSIRIWHSPRVKAGKRYASRGVGQIEVDSIEPIELDDITPELARKSGFNGVVDLLKIAKHGSGTKVYLVRFHYVGPGAAAKVAVRKPPNGDRQRERVARMVGRLPQAETKRVGQHMSLAVRNKRFGWFLVDHHGDGRVALNCKASAEMHDMLRELMPQHLHVPKYAGRWVGIWLDLPKVDWRAVEMALSGAYQLAAPRQLLRR